jgi:hypothetical protein
MAKKFWWPGSMPDQLVLIQNFVKKIAGYAVPLAFTPAQIAAAEALCEAFIGAFSSTEQCKTTMQAMTQWRDEVFYGEPFGTPAPAAPVFPVIGVVTYTRGVVKEFFDLRDLIVASPGYNVGIGEDLGIVGAEIAPIAPDLVSPNLKASTSAGYTVNLAGSMQGMDAMRVEYAPKGGNFTTVAFLTNTPGGFQITPANPNNPETGHIRAVFIKKNADFGNYSADYPVTLS